MPVALYTSNEDLIPPNTVLIVGVRECRFVGVNSTGTVRVVYTDTLEEDEVDPGTVTVGDPPDTVTIQSVSI